MERYWTESHLQLEVEGGERGFCVGVPMTDFLGTAKMFLQANVTQRMFNHQKVVQKNPNKHFLYLITNTITNNSINI